MDIGSLVYVLQYNCGISVLLMDIKVLVLVLSTSVTVLGVCAVI